MSKAMPRWLGTTEYIEPPRRKGLHLPTAPYGSCRKMGELMKHLFTPALFGAALSSAALCSAVRPPPRRSGYPELKPEQLSPQQKAYIEGLAKPPRNNTTAVRTRRSRSICQIPTSRANWRRCRTTCAGAPGLSHG